MISQFSSLTIQDFLFKNYYMEMKCHTVTGYQTIVTFCLIGDLAGFNIPCNYKIISSSVFTAKKK